MKNIRKSASDSVYLLVIALLVLYLFALSAPADAQQAIFAIWEKNGSTR